MNTGAVILTVLICAFYAIGIALICRFTYRKIPMKWLADYEAIPDEDGVTVKLIIPERETKGKYLFWTLFLPSCALLAPSIYLEYGVSFSALALLLALPLCLLISACDILYKTLPNQLTALLLLPAASFAVGKFVFFEEVLYSHPLSPLIGALIGGGILLVINLFGKLAFKKLALGKEAVGFGDVKLFAVLGLCLGAKYTVVAFFIMLFSAFIQCVIILAAGKSKKGSYIPLAPYICLGFFAAACFKEEIDTLLNLYFALFQVK